MDSHPVLMRSADALRFTNALLDTLSPGFRKPLSVSPIILIIILKAQKREKSGWFLFEAELCFLKIQRLKL